MANTKSPEAAELLAPHPCMTGMGAPPTHHRPPNASSPPRPITSLFPKNLPASPFHCHPRAGLWAPPSPRRSLPWGWIWFGGAWQGGQDLTNKKPVERKAT